MPNWTFHKAEDSRAGNVALLALAPSSALKFLTVRPLRCSDIKKVDRLGARPDQSFSSALPTLYR